MAPKSGGHVRAVMCVQRCFQIVLAIFWHVRMVNLKTSPADAKSWNHCPYLIFHGVLYGSAFEYAGSELCLVEVGPGRPYACVHLSKFLWEELEFAAMWKPHNPTWKVEGRRWRGIKGKGRTLISQVRRNRELGAPWLWRMGACGLLDRGYLGLFLGASSWPVHTSNAPGHPLAGRPPIFWTTSPFFTHGSSGGVSKKFKKGPIIWSHKKARGIEKGEKQFWDKREKSPIKIAATPAQFPESYFFCLFLLPLNFVRP